MKTITIKVYSFDELSDSAKEKARSVYRSDGHYYAWGDENIYSLKAFCDYFSVVLTDYSIGTSSYSWVKTNATNQNFRGLKLKTIDRDYMPTGYSMDCSLWMTFYDVFKLTGNALQAFNDAIDQFIKDTVSDMEFQESDEYIDEMMSMNEFEFNQDGDHI